MTTQNTLLTIGDYEARAKETMPKALFDRLFGDLDAHDWTTNTANVRAMDAVKLRPRVLVDVSDIDTSTEVLGQRISLPVMLAPTGHAPEGASRWRAGLRPGRGGADTIMGLSTASSYSIEEVAGVAENPLWFQLYFFPGSRAYRDTGAPRRKRGLHRHDADGGQPGRQLQGARVPLRLRAGSGANSQEL